MQIPVFYWNDGSVNITVSKISKCINCSKPSYPCHQWSNYRVCSSEWHSDLCNVTLGASSDTDSEVTAGNLQPGDLIILNPLLQVSRRVLGEIHSVGKRFING